jgi:cellulose synthase/poly-beta-1,6-N-acetylglucosamine synthase-like glycosyltransferase
MSKNFKKPGIPSRPSQSQMQQFRDPSLSETDVPTGPRQFQVPVTPILHEEYQAQYNSHNASPNVMPSNDIPSFQTSDRTFYGTRAEGNGDFSQQGMYTGYGPQQYQVPATPFFGVPRVPTTPSIDIPTSPFPNLPTTPPSGVITIPATPFPAALPDVVDPHKRDRLDKYAQWLQINNNLPASPQKTQAYQEAALEIKKIGKREVRTFAPFQERSSALQVITSSQLTVLALLGVCWMAGLLLLHIVVFTITLSILTTLYIFGFITSGILATKSFSGISGEHIDEGDITALDELGVEWPTYTVLCPLYKETAIVPQFVEAMKSLDYPAEKLQVLFLTEENDSETRAALYSMRLPAGFTVLTVPKGSPQTKPRACNFGLLQAKGQFIVIFDAEDKPEPYQLKKAVLAFANLGSEIACVQAKLNYYNTRQNLLTRWFTAEYSTWFDIMLPGLQQSSFSLPLGGTSNHFRTEVLRALGGWDAFNVTEDCDLGLRISQYGLKTAVLDSTTYEEATSRVKTWLFQRSRWIKGYLQTYLVHMRHPLQMLQQKHLRKFISLQIIVGAWTVVLLINPLMWALTLIYILLRPVHLYSLLFPGPILYMGAFCLIFGNFFYVYVHLIGCVRRKEHDLIKWVLLIPLYWVMMSISAYIAFYQLLVKPHYWEKTQHGNHLAPSAKAQAQLLTQHLGQDGSAVVVSMPTTRLFAVTVGRIFKQTATEAELGTTTQRVEAVRGVLSTRFERHKIKQKTHEPHTRDIWLMATIVISFIASVSTCIYYYLHNQILLYGDSHSHLGIARRLFDSSNTWDITQLVLQ